MEKLYSRSEDCCMPRIRAAAFELTGIEFLKAVPILRSVNSLLLSGWRYISRQTACAGKWIAIYNVQEGNRIKRQVEMVRCRQTSGNELNGDIVNEENSDKYKFNAHFELEEVVGHYWPVETGRDTGTFRLQPGGRGIFKGHVNLYHSATGKLLPDIDYTWYRYHGKIREWFFSNFRPVRASLSPIAGTGVFANTRFKKDKVIGNLKLGSESAQGQHTILLGGQHVVVIEPWRFLNHACVPNARLEFLDRDVRMVAIQEIFPQTEITFDYRTLGEKLSEEFECSCPTCRQSGSATKITGSEKGSFLQQKLS
ncbi:MAG: SET domain-containing protein-lysine N-methyltransferase [Methylocystis sp.]